ncbi:hypothetical protein K3172_05750 [Qipengyuania sp. 6B39]|uniref:hypothetical protein n=1 Tax=Qipengyuania proteolytica TaxID=2867239 RepID=UPI001C893FCA|nr:hypothetical protein [Qipengyuania proteolytica]MBX7495356.1 hypothetical protein [Qipengyuania proteolytica]
MGRSFLFYAVAAIGLVIVASNADDIEGRHSEASMTETLIVVGGVLLFVLVARLAMARFNARRERG